MCRLSRTARTRRQHPRQEQLLQGTAQGRKPRHVPPPCQCPWTLSTRARLLLLILLHPGPQHQLLLQGLRPQALGQGPLPPGPSLAQRVAWRHWCPRGASASQQRLGTCSCHPLGPAPLQGTCCWTCSSPHAPPRLLALRGSSQGAWRAWPLRAASSAPGSSCELQRWGPLYKAAWHQEQGRGGVGGRAERKPHGNAYVMQGPHLERQWHHQKSSDRWGNGF